MKGKAGKLDPKQTLAMVPLPCVARSLRLQVNKGEKAASRGPGGRGPLRCHWEPCQAQRHFTSSLIILKGEG